MASIGQSRLSPREVAANDRLLDALGQRGFTFAGIEPAPGGVIAVAVNGQRMLVHYGRNPVDAKFQLARLASAPAGRGF